VGWEPQYFKFAVFGHFSTSGKTVYIAKLKYSIKQQAICLLSQAKFGLQVQRELVGIKALAIENWGKI